MLLKVMRLTILLIPLNLMATAIETDSYNFCEGFEITKTFSGIKSMSLTTEFRNVIITTRQDDQDRVTIKYFHPFFTNENFVIKPEKETLLLLLKNFFPPIVTLSSCKNCIDADHQCGSTTYVYHSNRYIIYNNGKYFYKGVMKIPNINISIPQSLNLNLVVKGNGEIEIVEELKGNFKAEIYNEGSIRGTTINNQLTEIYAFNKSVFDFGRVETNELKSLVSRKSLVDIESGLIDDMNIFLEYRSELDFGGAVKNGFISARSASKIFIDYVTGDLKSDIKNNASLQIKDQQ